MRVRLKGINRVRKQLADGTWVTYYYAWKGGPRLEGEPGTPQFIASYNAAVASHVREPKKIFRSVIDLYKDSPQYTGLKENTKRGYKRYLDIIEKEFGALPLSVIDRRVRRDFMEWRDRMGKDGARQADLAFAVLSRVITWALDRDYISYNPCVRPGRLYKGSRRDKVWTEEQEATFYAKAPQYLHLALTLGLWTGQRKADLLQLKWSNYDGSYIRLEQGKTGARVAIPVAQSLREALDAEKAAQVERADREGKLHPENILVSMAGTPWTVAGFTASWFKACAKAGIVGVTFHDLRGTAVTRLALADGTVPEIATITGHSLKDVEAILDKHYLNRNSGLGESAIRKLELKRNSQPNSQLPVEGRVTSDANS